jgi:hypothetical protein
MESGSFELNSPEKRSFCCSTDSEPSNCKRRDKMISNQKGFASRRIRTCGLRASARMYPAREHLDRAVSAGRNDTEVEHRRELEAQEPDAAERARERAGPGPSRREALERAGVQEGLHASGVPQERADAVAGDPVRQPDALTPARQQPGPPSCRRPSRSLLARLVIVLATCHGSSPSQ